MSSHTEDVLKGTETSICSPHIGRQQGCSAATCMGLAVGQFGEVAGLGGASLRIQVSLRIGPCAHPPTRCRCLL